MSNVHPILRDHGPPRKSPPPAPSKPAAKPQGPPKKQLDAKSLAEHEEKIAAHTKMYEDNFANPYVAARKGYIDDIIMPHSTRRRIAKSLRALANKQLENPWKKHDNIPL